MNKPERTELQKSRDLIHYYKTTCSKCSDRVLPESFCSTCGTLHYAFWFGTKPAQVYRAVISMYQNRPESCELIHLLLYHLFGEIAYFNTVDISIHELNKNGIEKIGNQIVMHVDIMQQRMVRQIANATESEDEKSKMT